MSCGQSSRNLNFMIIRGECIREVEILNDECVVLAVNYGNGSVIVWGRER